MGLRFPNIQNVVLRISISPPKELTVIEVCNKMTVCLFYRMDNPGRSDSSSLQTGLNKEFPNQGKVSLTSSVKSIKQRNNLDRTVQSLSIAGLYFLNACDIEGKDLNGLHRRRIEKVSNNFRVIMEGYSSTGVNRELC